MNKYFVIIYNGTKKIASTYKNAESKEWAEIQAEWAFMCLHSNIEFTHAVAKLAETDD